MFLQTGKISCKKVMSVSNARSFFSAQELCICVNLYFSDKQQDSLFPVLLQESY